MRPASVARGGIWSPKATTRCSNLPGSRDAAKWHFLADQFRSTPEIVDYLNDEFYEGRLLASQDPRRVRLPNGYAPGIAWHDVPGQASREDGGSVNHAEADAIVAALTEMIRGRNFDGSIGVLSPFNAQVGLLIRRIRAAITEVEQARSISASPRSTSSRVARRM